MTDRAENCEALQCVLEQPWPDAIRLAYSHSIESVDPTRSQFVRLGLSLTQALRNRERYSEWSTLEQRLSQLAPQALRAQWGAALIDVVGPKAQVQFGRGFPEGITIDAAQFLAQATRIYAVAPILDLRIVNVAKVADAFFQSPLLARIRSLDFAEYSLTAELVGKLARSPFLAQLLWLNLYFQPCGNAGFEHLAASDRLPNLTWVGGGGKDTPDVNPLPMEDESGVYGYAANPYAAALSRRFGPKRWLRAEWNSHEQPRPEALSKA